MRRTRKHELCAIDPRPLIDLLQNQAILRLKLLGTEKPNDEEARRPCWSGMTVGLIVTLVFRSAHQQAKIESQLPLR